MVNPVILYHAPQTRSTGVLNLLEELKAPYEIRLLNLKAGEQRQPAYLAVNPMGKVPAIEHNGAVITEQVAIYIYLADFFASAGLAPALTDPLRGPYLRWIAFYAGCVEPAVISHYMKYEPAPRATSPYGTYELVVKTLSDQLARGPYITGERFTAADVLWGGALGWLTQFKMIPQTPEIMAYIERITSRPAYKAAMEIEAKYERQQAASA